MSNWTWTGPQRVETVGPVTSVIVPLEGSAFGTGALGGLVLTCGLPPGLPGLAVVDVPGAALVLGNGPAVEELKLKSTTSAEIVDKTHRAMRFMSSPFKGL